MTAQLICLKNTLVPHRRTCEQVEPRTLKDYDPKWDLPYVAFINGEVILRAEWDRRVEHGDVVAFVDVNAIPQGGGGGGDSNPLAMILMIAVMVYAPYLASSMMGGEFVAAGAVGFAAGGAMGTALTIGIGMAGAMLVNAILPPSTAQTSAQKTASLASPSPTYSLQAQGNTARLEAAIPEHFGRMVAYMDFAAQPYVEFSGNEQFLYQLLCVGRGEYAIEAIRIEDTAISSFDEITYEVLAPHASPTLFPTAVVSSTEVSGQELPCKSATYSQTATVITVTLVAHGYSTGKSLYLDFTSGAATDGSYTVVSAPTADTFTVAAASANTSGSVTVSAWVGPFVASAAGTTANFLGVDYVMPRGIYYIDTGTGALSEVTITVLAECRTIDDAGAPTGAWTTLGQEVYSAATTTPQRYSKRYDPTDARFEVRVRRVDIEQTGRSYGHSVVWAGLRAYLPEVRDFGDVTLIAMRMKASNNLSMQASRKVNVIATRKLPIWNGAIWSANTATRSIAWPIAYACKQVGLTDAQIDLATLLTLDGVWTTRGDCFDARFDNFLSFWEAVTKIAGAGRAKPYMQGGVMRFMRDQAATVLVALFSMRNIVKGSFSIDYLMPTADTADAIDVGYFDSGNWAPRRVRAKLPGSTAARPAKMELFGVTNRDHAFREGMYQAASNRYRRKIIKFQTEMEGFIPSFGDPIAIQHDMPAWGQGGEVTAWGFGSNLLLQSACDTGFTAEGTTPPTKTDQVAHLGGSSTSVLFTSLSATGYGGSRVCHYSGNANILTGLQYTHSLYLALSRPLVGAETIEYYWTGGTGLPNLTINSANSAQYVGAFGRLQVPFTSPASTNVYPVIYLGTGLASDLTVYVNRGQMETGAVASPYVPTTTTTRINLAVLALSEPPTWDTGTHYIALRKRDGGMDGPYAVTLGGTANEVVLTSGPYVVTPDIGGDRERTHYTFGVAETWRQPARVLAVRPRGLYSVEIEAINEDASVHTAETGQVAPAIQTSQLANYTNAPVIEDLSGLSMPGSPEKMLLTWKPSAWAEYYIVEQSSDGTHWTRTGESTASNYTATALYGAATLIRVAAVGMARGPWVQINYGLLADYMWAADDTTLMWNTTDTTLMWRY